MHFQTFEGDNNLCNTTRGIVLQLAYNFYKKSSFKSFQYLFLLQQLSLQVTENNVEILHLLSVIILTMYKETGKIKMG